MITKRRACVILMMVAVTTTCFSEPPVKAEKSFSSEIRAAIRSSIYYRIDESNHGAIVPGTVLRGTGPVKLISKATISKLLEKDWKWVKEITILEVPKSLIFYNKNNEVVAALIVPAGSKPTGEAFGGIRFKKEKDKGTIKVDELVYENGHLLHIPELRTLLEL